MKDTVRIRRECRSCRHAGVVHTESRREARSLFAAARAPCCAVPDLIVAIDVQYRPAPDLSIWINTVRWTHAPDMHGFVTAYGELLTDQMELPGFEASQLDSDDEC